ncbi:GTP-binding protein [Entamoeba marina]
MPKVRPKNKRQKLSKKHAIEKKIAQHNKKMKKLAKQFPESRRKIKKDPGIPHLYPFKEDLIRKYEAATNRKEQKMKEAKNNAGGK